MALQPHKIYESEQLAEVDRQIIELVLIQDTEENLILRRQLSHVQNIRKIVDENGYYLYIQLDRAALPCATSPDLKQVRVRIAGEGQTLLCSLFLKQGKISSLSCSKV